MSSLINLQATREVLQQLAQIVKSTREILAAIAQEMYRAGGAPGCEQRQPLSDTLEHVGDVRQGFILSQRTSPNASLAELRALVRHVLQDWDWLESLDLLLPQAVEIEMPRHQLVAYNHALVALAVLPRLPADVVTFPQRRPTYRDLNLPPAPTAILERIEEIERVIYQAEVMPARRLAYHPFRRTYAFFEASTWLVDNYLTPLLGGSGH